MKYNQRSVTSLMQQMFVVSDCLLRLGYPKLAIVAQKAQYWEFANDFAALIKREARCRNDYDTIHRLAHAGLVA